METGQLAIDRCSGIYNFGVDGVDSLADAKKKIEIFEKRDAMSHEEAVQLIWAVSSSYRQKSSPIRF
ncbi:MAG TPA: hypothetical protein DCX77_00700 [Acidimicrobiaceae bacterium]|nr:hypothetical protein [Acidimicrobiaceae bacterium]HAX04170.1 hypothetical protein [Acidimicrobiaceae bacterium]